MASFPFSPWRLLRVGVVLFALLAAAGLTWLGFGRLEGTAPTVTLQPAVPGAVGPATELTVTAEDAQTGVARLRVDLLQAGREVSLLEETPGGGGIFGRGKTPRLSRKVGLDPRALGLAEGPAVLRIVVEDASWRRFGRGNLVELRFETRIDTRPPGIADRGPQTAVAPGGTGLAVYHLTEPCPTSGVRVGEEFFPGFGGLFPEDPRLHLAFFALPHDAAAPPAILLEAVDEAGNRAQIRLPFFFRKKTYRRDALPVTDAFIRQLLPEFEGLPLPAEAGLKEKFLWINRDLRGENYRAITAVTRRSRPEMLWEGAFLRMPNSAQRAGFAERRTYLYEGRPIDQQDHLGIDLASTAQAPVPAANAGVVAFVGPMGIYGRTILVDHGLGLFTMYSHLSETAVSPGERVAREQILGRTGATGLAAGDHLHFSVLVHHRFVDPVEWWDPLWIREHVMQKIEVARGGAKAAPAAPPAEGSGGRPGAKRPVRGR
ncbi:MAG: M23 family metallopeptidase [Desulfobacterales bacterium]